MRAPLELGQAVRAASPGFIALLAADAAPLPDGLKRLGFLAGARVSVFIGPEGGFTADETETAVCAGLVPVSLGVNTLRAETACAAACAILCAA